MAIDKKIPRYLNQDSDYILTDVSEMTDARNVRISATDNGDGGVIKNAKGNISISLSQSLPIGNNRVVGVCENDSENELYFFVWNSQENHTIWKYSPRVSSDVTLVIQSDALEFYPESQLHTNAVLVNDSIYLYFTDGLSEPKKVNVKRAIAGGYLTGVTKAERVSEITVIRKYPERITGIFETDYNKKTNNIFGSTFQFVAQYKYKDEDVSALGQYSSLFASNNTLDNVDRSEVSEIVHNKIALSLNVVEPVGMVESVKFFVRKNAEGTFYYIGEVNNIDFVNGVASLDFYNNGNYPAVADSEFNKLEDAVPRKAQAQTVAGNRLVYGNYVEGFDKTNATATIEPVYERAVSLLPLDLHILPTDENDNVVIYWDLTNVPNSTETEIHYLTSDSIVAQSNYTHDVVKYIALTTPLGTFFDFSSTVKFNIAQYNEVFSYIINPQTDRADAAAQMIAAYPDEVVFSVATPISTAANVTRVTDLSQGKEFDVYFSGTITFEAVSQTYYASSPDSTFIGKPIIKFVWRVKEFNISATAAKLVSSGNPADPIGFIYEDVSANLLFQNTANEALTITGLQYTTESLEYNQAARKTFKAHDTHSFGIVYCDKYGRGSGVQKLGSVDIAGLHDPVRLGKRGYSKVNITMTSPIPTWASGFSFVYDGGREYNSYVQYSIIEAMLPDPADSELSDADLIYLSLRGLQGKDQSYTVEDDAVIKYTFAEGDRLRVLKYRTGTNDYVYPLDLNFEVVGFVNYDDPITSKLIPVGQTPTQVTDFRKTGYFVKVRALNYAGFTKQEILQDADKFNNQVVVELYSPRQASVIDSVYYDVSPIFPISQHAQTITITEGNAWFTRRVINHLPWDSGTNQGDKSSKSLVGIADFVESEYYSDFIDIKARSKGKPRGVIENEKEVTRYASITYSEPYLQDSSRLWLSSFNNSLANWMDYDVMNGGIYGLVNMDQSIMMLQEDKVAVIPMNKQIITTATGSTVVGISTDFLGNAQYYEGKFGINKNRGAFVLAEGDVYIFDVQRGSVYQLGAKGVARISSFGMSSYFENLGTELTEFESQQIGGSLPNLGSRNLYKINMGHDRENSEIVISVVKGVEDEFALIGESYIDINWNYSKPAIAFDYSENKWISFRDINCDSYATMGNLFYHLKNVGGNIVWASEQNETHCNFFGVQKTSWIETVFNTAKFNRKVYHALSIDGSAAADVTISTKTQTASLVKAAFELKEDEYFSSLPRVGGNNEYVSLGIVVSKNGNQITFGNRINRMPFRLGGEIFAFVGGSYATKSATIQSVVSANTILVSNGTNINISDSLVVKGDSSIDGDPLRGSYAKTKFEFSNTDAIEILAVNASVSDSKLHNPNANQQ